VGIFYDIIKIDLSIYPATDSFHQFDRCFIVKIYETNKSPFSIWTVSLGGLREATYSADATLKEAYGQYNKLIKG
jgi:hypothetical protein